MRAREQAVDSGVAGEIEKAIESLSQKIREGDIPPVDFIIFGSCSQEGNSLSLHCSLMDFHKGIIINSIEFSESGHEALSELCLRLSRRIYEVIPFRGRVLNLKEKGIVVNLGLFDGIAPGSMLMLQKIPSRGEWVLTPSG